MTSETTATPALGTSALEPVPVEGCAICAAAATKREAARRLGSVVSLRSANDVIQQHPHRRATDAKEPVYVPGLGEWATDVRTGRVGSVVRWDGSTLTLRGPGGEEWDTVEFRRPTARERLVPRVAEANRRTARRRV